MHLMLDIGPLNFLVFNKEHIQCFVSIQPSHPVFADIKLMRVINLYIWILSFQLLGMAFSMTLFHQIHRSGKKYDA